MYCIARSFSFDSMRSMLRINSFGKYVPSKNTVFIFYNITRISCGRQKKDRL